MRSDAPLGWRVQWDFLERVPTEGSTEMLKCDALPNFHKEGRG